MVLTTDLATLTATYEALGFRPTPESGRHRGTDRATGAVVELGTANRHVVFADSSIELLGLLDPAAPDPWGVGRLLAPYAGVRGFVFGCADAAAEDARLNAAGIRTTGVLDFSRPVDTPDGTATMHARTAHVLPMITPEGGIGIAEQRTIELVRQPRHQVHPNGAVALAAVTLVVADAELDAYVDRYRTLLAVEPDVEAPRWVFRLPKTRVEIVPASELATALPGEVAPVLPYMAALTIAVSDVDDARAVVDGNRVATRDVSGGFLVNAAAAGGSAVHFVAA